MVIHQKAATNSNSRDCPRTGGHRCEPVPLHSGGDRRVAGAGRHRAATGRHVRDQRAADHPRRRRVPRRRGRSDAHSERQPTRTAGIDRRPPGACTSPQRSPARAVAHSPGEFPHHRQREERAWHRAHNVNEIFFDGVTVSYHGGDGILLDYCYEDPRICQSLITYNKGTGLEPARVPRYRRLGQPVRGEPGRAALLRRLQPVHDRQLPRRSSAATAS